MLLRRRLHKLEAALEARSVAVSSTAEERKVLLYEVSLGMLRRNTISPENKTRAAEVSAMLAGDFQRTAAAHATPAFQAHLGGWVTDMWTLGHGTGPFLPPITGSEYDDWEAPNLFPRRLAIRRLPSIVRLIGAANTRAQLQEPVLVPDWKAILSEVLAARREKSR